MGGVGERVKVGVRRGGDEGMGLLGEGIDGMREGMDRCGDRGRDGWRGCGRWRGEMGGGELRVRLRGMG